MLVRQLAQEWASDGIRTNMVAPGLIETPLTASVYADQALRRSRETAVPLGRIGRPDDVASAIFFLASREASYVTGQILAIDGGIADASLLRIPGLPKT
jgi:NAD(P)-dependent dehydrogenase (short-subunit alcohol dehydrogenase family)